jgi:hypothetical protein
MNFVKVLGRQSFTSSINSLSSGSLTSGTSSSGLIAHQQKPAALALAQAQFIVNNSTVGACICVTSGSCALASGGSSAATDGSGSIDIRIVNVSASCGSMTNRVLINAYRL